MHFHCLFRLSWIYSSVLELLCRQNDSVLSAVAWSVIGPLAAVYLLWHISVSFPVAVGQTHTELRRSRLKKSVNMCICTTKITRGLKNSGKKLSQTWIWASLSAWRGGRTSVALFSLNACCCCQQDYTTTAWLIATEFWREMCPATDDILMAKGQKSK